MSIPSLGRLVGVPFVLVFTFLPLVALGQPGPDEREERRARHILVGTEKECDDLIARIEAGESFLTLCREHSRDVVTKRTGGDLQWVRPNGWPGIDVVFNVPEVGGVTKGRTQYGWHVVQYLESKFVKLKKPPTNRPPAATTKKKTVPEKKPAGPTAEKSVDSPTGVTKPTRDKEARRAARNKDLKVALDFATKDHLPGQDISFTIQFTNTTGEALNVFNPSLWPLGLSGRYWGRTDKQEVELADLTTRLEPVGGLTLDLAAGQTLSREFRLQDHVTSVDIWPTIRMRWQAKTFFKNLESTHPEIVKHGDYATWKARWARYGSAHRALTVLPSFKDGGKWYARFYLGRSQRNVFVELQDPGVPGLMDFFFDRARETGMSRMPLSDMKAGQYVLAEAAGDKVPIFTLPSRYDGKKPGPYSLALAVESLPAADATRGSVYFTLKNPELEPGNHVPIGKVVLNADLLDVIAEGRPKDRLMAPMIALVELYPADVLPKVFADEIRGAKAGAPTARDAGPTTRAAEPTSILDAELGTQGTKDNPMVELIVDDFVLTLELYEDNAPNTVANFVTLVESGFYDGKVFHLRSENDLNKGWIQGGSPTGNETGRLDYYIKSEDSSPLKHRRGTIAMAGRRDGSPDTASCQFYICFDPQHQLDGTYTIFGRVKSGLESLEKSPVGATIRKATVQRKRDHSYTPQTIPIPGG